MTDESNALVQIILNREEMPKVSQEGAVGTECFDGFLLLTKEEAQKILKDGYRTVDIMSEGCKKVSTSEMGDLLVKALE